MIGETKKRIKEAKVRKTTKKLSGKETEKQGYDICCGGIKPELLTDCGGIQPLSILPPKDKE